MTLSGNFSYLKIWEGAKRAISSDLGITEKIRSCVFRVFKTTIATKRSKILTKFCTQVFKQKISAKFVDGQSRLDRVKWLPF